MRRYSFNESKSKAGYSVSFSHKHGRLMWLCCLSPRVLAASFTSDTQTQDRMFFLRQEEGLAATVSVYICTQHIQALFIHLHMYCIQTSCSAIMTRSLRCFYFVFIMYCICSQNDIWCTSWFFSCMSNFSISRGSRVSQRLEFVLGQDKAIVLL